jgi:ATP-dependent RNA helicase RhlB
VYELPDIERYIGKKIPSAFADETLLAEDKSAGTRIRVDDYDDRGRRGDRNRDNRRGDGRRIGSVAFRGEGRRREGSSSAPPRRSGPRSRPERPRSEAGEGGGRDPRNDKRRDPPELAALSQEERMAYYKQKYETPARSGGNPASGEKSGNRTPREGGNRRRGGDQRRNDGRSRGDGGRRPNAERSGQAKQPGKGVPVAAAPQTGGEAKAKKGLLGRILGIFKKG